MSMTPSSRAPRCARAGSLLRALVVLLGGAVVGPLGPAPVPSAHAQEGATPPHWIWYSTGRPLAETPAETRYFRKEFAVKEPSRLVLDVTADNAFVLYLDGKEVAHGDQWQQVQTVEAKLATGPHVLAARATNEAPGPAGFLLRGGVLPLGQGVPIHTNASWRATDRAPEGDAWTRPGFDDRRWPHARDLGTLGTGPWTGLIFASDDASRRFKVPSGFEVTMVAAPKVTGSAVAFAFDAEGRPCVGVEQGPIVRLLDADKDGTYEGRQVIAPQMRNCQGFSFLGDRLFAVGDGPKGTGIYRLEDRDRDGVFEAVALVRAAKGGMGEHGPHSVQLGPDGCLYYNNGNHAHLVPPIDPKSPVNIFYEGELLPHFNDSRGHAAGIMAPGGEILRSDDGGKTWARVVAGFRNEYDFGFNRDGELFTFDSDMEWDIGLPWYRPVRVNHCVPGAEFGWRNGSGKWPPYYFDSLPGTLDIGRGSPTGVTFYQGKHFPREYDDNFLICDWSQGRILAVALTREGATYRARETELVSGQPLNCTDIEVGPDGAVYFTTGGRGTQGGLYRVRWLQDRPHLAVPKEGEPNLLRDALDIDSPLSSFSQRRLAQVRKAMGDNWGPKLLATANDAKAPAADRTRALDLLTQLGPKPTDETLITLAGDNEAKVRAKAVFLLGMRTTEPARSALADALGDKDPFVRRRACEGLVRSQGPIPIEKLLPLLDDPDRWIRYAARVAIEHGEVEAHRERILSANEPRPLLEGMLALVRATSPDKAAQDDLLERQIKLFEERLRPDEYLDLLRLIGLTYLRGPQKAADAPASVRFRHILVGSSEVTQKSRLLALIEGEGPRPNSLNLAGSIQGIARESARLLAYLNEPRAIEPILDAQASDPDHANQIHYAYCLRAITKGWTAKDKRRLWAWYETASHWDGGFSFLGYLDFMVQELIAQLSPEERSAYLADGARFPFPTRVLVRAIDLGAHSERIADLEALYPRVSAAESDNPNAAGELKALILEKLGQSRKPEAHAALRSIAQSDPRRRDLIARALADHPTADDLPLLVAALDSRDPNTTNVVLSGLLKLDRAPEGPEGPRLLIRLARRTGPASKEKLDRLAARWLQADPGSAPRDFAQDLAYWEGLYRTRFPNGPSPTEETTGANAYTLPQLVAEVLQSGLVRRGSPERGRSVLKKARCLECHKLGNEGQGLGPDLTTVSSRFRPHEILESIVEPSKVISDQYKPITVATTDGKVYNGMPTAADPRNLVLLLSDGTKVTIPKDEVDEQKESNVSVMPEGLLNGLTLPEIADLLALFEAQPKVEATPEKKSD